jgi:BirA family biotin operon repressor/biotin-[acetyl-CoA-carboxylase] ligase
MGPPELPLVWVDEIASTQDEMARRARRGEAPQALATTSQTAGRGRRGRSWSCPPGAGLALSVLLRPDRADGWTWLPLMAGVAVVSAVQSLGATGLALKWPNDVLADGAKLAGLLAERVEPSGSAGPGFVLGVGLNLRDDALPAGAVALNRLGVGSSAPTVAAAVLDGLATWLPLWEAGGERVAHAYRQACATLGQPVQVSLPDGSEVTGTAEAIDADGRLVVRSTDGHPRAFAAGDVVHLRRAPTPRATLG